PVRRRVDRRGAPVAGERARRRAAAEHRARGPLRPPDRLERRAQHRHLHLRDPGRAVRVQRVPGGSTHMTTPSTAQTPSPARAAGAADALAAADPEVAAAIAAEARRQEQDLELIASENYCSRAVRE